MDKTKYLKIFGMLAAIATAAVTALGGDYVTAVGIIAAAFSSSTALGPQQVAE